MTEATKEKIHESDGFTRTVIITYIVRYNRGKNTGYRVIQHGRLVMLNTVFMKRGKGRRRELASGVDVLGAWISWPMVLASEQMCHAFRVHHWW